MSAPPTPWLRRLPHRPEPAPASPPRIDTVHPGRGTTSSPPAARTERPATAAAPVPAARIDLRHPARGGAQPPAPAAPRSDLGRPSTMPASPPAGRLTSLTPDTPTAPASPSAAPPRRGQALLLRPPPGVQGVVTLDPEDPVVRLDALQSGIGALGLQGAERVAWQDVDDRSGVVEGSGASTGDDVPRHGNRSLLRPLDGGFVVTLRHVRALRRLLIDAPANTALAVAPYCAGVVRAADPAARLRVSVVVVEGRLDVRAEYGLPEPWRAALDAMGWSPLASVPRATPEVWA